MSQYRVAVLGAGDRGKAYSKALKQLDKDCVLVNICDLQEERAQKAKEEFGYEETTRTPSPKTTSMSSSSVHRLIFTAKWRFTPSIIRSMSSVKSRWTFLLKKRAKW